MTRHVHGEVRAGPRRLELPHPLQPVARRRQRVRRRVDELGPVAVLRRLPLVPRRLDRARARGDGVLRADGQLLQALRRRLVGADAARVELRQPHRRFPRRRARTRACASSAASPARTAIRTSRSPRRSPRASTASRNRIEPPECFTGDIYAARHLPRVPYTLREGRRMRFAASEFAQTRLRRRRRRALRPLLPDRAAPSTRPSPTGSGGATSSGSEPACEPTSRTRWRSSRAPAAASAAKRRSCSPRKAPRSSSWIVDEDNGRDRRPMRSRRRAAERVSCTADVSRNDDCAAMVATAEREFGRSARAVQQRRHHGQPRRRRRRHRRGRCGTSR